MYWNIAPSAWRLVSQRLRHILPVGVTPAAEFPVVASAAPGAWIELRLAKERTLRFESNIDDAALTRLIRAVDAA